MVHNTTVDNNKSELAIQYLEDLIYDCLLDTGEPMRTGEILKSMENQVPVTLKLLRHVMSTSERFTTVNRRWDLSIKYREMHLPMQRLIQTVLEEYGRPISGHGLGQILSVTLNRSHMAAYNLVERMTTDPLLYVKTPKDEIGLQKWILQVNPGDSEDTVKFENFELEQGIEEAVQEAEGISWDPSDLVSSIAAYLEKVDKPVSNLVLNYLCWLTLRDDFDAVSLFHQMLDNPKILLLSGLQWVPASRVTEFKASITEKAKEAEKMQFEPEEEDLTPIEPPTIVPDDLDEIEKVFQAKETSQTVAEIVEQLFEYTPGERGYTEAAEVLKAALETDSRFMWVGSERWRLAGTTPDYVNEIAEMLHVPELTFETPEGERLDLELEEDGLDGSLQGDIKNPLVLDIPVQYDKRIKYVLTYPHFHTGTMPSVAGFFPSELSLVEVVFKDNQGNFYNCWVNNKLNMVFGLEAWFEKADLPISGAIFHVDVTDQPDVFLLDYTGEIEELTYVSPDRIQQLEEIGEEAGEDWSTFDIVRAIMEDYSKGIHFITLFTETNIVRRTNPSLVASLLSSFHCFYQKQKETSVWHYDEHKLSQGFKKTKRKYIRK